MRQKRLVVAVVSDDDGKLLVHFNPKWEGYTFPMADLDDGVEPSPARALQALEKDLGQTLPGAEVKELEFIVLTGDSTRTGEPTEYRCQLYSVKPSNPLVPPEADDANPHPPLWANYPTLVARKDLTWSAIGLVREFVENQRAVLAVVTRAGLKETEYLLVRNHNYGGYFFPTQRVKNESALERSGLEELARQIVRDDLHYNGPTLPPDYRGPVLDRHFSKRFQWDRKYTFETFHVRIPDMDLHRPGNLLEKTLAGNGIESIWVPMSRRENQSVPLTETIVDIWAQVAALIPPQVIPQPLRESEGGIALIRRDGDGKRQWLAQWNERWKSYFFVGGHREGTESFRACVAREIGEELGLTPEECPVAAGPAHQLKYRAISRSAGELTAYTMELFEAQPTAAALEKIDDNPLNTWLGEDEIRMLGTAAEPVSVSMLVLLDEAGLIG